MTLTIEQVADIKREIVILRDAIGSAKGMKKAALIKKLLEAYEKVADAGDVRELAGGEMRRDTSGFYSVRVKGGTSRQKLNNRAVELIEKLKAEGREPTDEERAELAKFSGYGGGLIDPVTGQKGSAYEYYTPKPVAEAVWGLLEDMGFKGGKVLDPSSGTGIFGATSPKNCVVDAVELSEQSGMVNKLVNDGPGYKTTISPFEEFASNTADEIYDAVVTNVPFGTVNDRGLNRLKDASYRDEPLENYFILRSLEKLRPSGMAAFIVPTRCVSGKGGKPEELRVAASRMAEFIGAYRLPTGTFSSADTDTVTDIIFFRKYSEEAREKIDALREQNPQILIDAKVNWKTFTDGKYFESTEGAKYVIGEFQAKDETKFRDVDKVIFNGDLSAIVRELKAESRPLPKSRIDWALLDTAETLPIEYRDGDTIRQGGRTYQMKGGRWIAMAVTEKDEKAAKLAHDLRDPYAAFVAGVTLDSVRTIPAGDDMAGWVREALQSVKVLPDEEAKALWNTGLVAFSVRQVLEERKNDTGVKYIDEYKALSDAMQRLNVSKAQIAKTSGELKIALKITHTHYNRKDKFSAFWRGDVVQEVKKTEAVASALDTPEMKLARLQYETKTPWLDVDKVREIKGADWNPLTDSDYCISEDGKRVIKASDYYVGNYGEFLKRIDTQIEGATDEGLKAKLLRQKIDAESRVTRLDASALKFSIHTPWVTPEEKLAFLKKFVDPAACIVKDNDLEHLDIQIKDPKTDEDKVLNRYGDYLQRMTVSLGGMEFDFGYGEDIAAIKALDKDEQAAMAGRLRGLRNEARTEALKMLRQVITETDAQFNSWVHSNEALMARITAEFNDVTKLRFKDEDDQSDIAIPGMKPTLKLHGYQAAYVRKMGREFSGINGFGVGLGKTFTALAAVQHVQAIGVKKKTIFVVPNSTLSNWRKEANSAYSDTSDCLFVGLREGRGGKMQVKSVAYIEDLWKVKENRHSKIFMTMEAFQMIRIRRETIEDYIKYMRGVDKSFRENDDKKDTERKNGKLSKIVETLFEQANKESGAPNLEDMGIDSIVIDEAHNYKNSINVCEFKSAKFLALTEACARGFDAQLKCWYVRGLTAANDGVLLLTATPLTNSPLEIASMLTLAAGVERLNNSSNIKGTDDFMTAICKVTNAESENIAGMPVNVQVFQGLDNVRVLRNAIAQTITVREASEVGMTVHIPDREEHSEGVTISEETQKLIALYKGAYLYARELAKEEGKIKTRGFSQPKGKPEILNDKKLKAAFIEVSRKFNEPIELVGHPFNLLTKMTNIIMDPEIDERASFYTFPADQAAIAKKVVDSFNKLAIKEDRARLTPRSKIFKELRKKDENGDELTYYSVTVGADIEADGRIAIDTLDYGTQCKFEALAEKAGLDLGVSISPKIAALLKNFQNEQSNPRGLISEDVISPIVKQIIFCDILAVHNKIRRVLSQKAGVPSSKIAIITGKTNGKPEEIQEVQDGFNAQGEDNRFSVVIANEKAEVGINLQKGTQAIHHLTVGWTPDSVEQRNGRGARQGNASEKVTIYYYEADGSFDKIKRTMLNKKSEWISKVLSSDGGDEVEVSGGMSREMQEKLALSDGSEESLRKIQQEQEEDQRRARVAQARAEQVTYAKTIIAQQEYLKKSASPVDEVKGHFVDLIRLYKSVEKCEKEIKKATSDKALAKWTQKRDNAKEEFDKLKAAISSSVNIVYGKHAGALKAGRPISFTDVFEEAMSSETLERKMLERMTGYRYEYTENMNGALLQTWAEDQALAKKMIEESLKNLQNAKDKPGALPDSMVEAARNGILSISDTGEFLMPEMAVVKDGVPFFARSTGELDSWEVRGIDTKHKAGDKYWNTLAPVSVKTLGVENDRDYSQSGNFTKRRIFSFFGEDIVYPGEARYEEFAKMAAKAEDDQDNGDYPFSKECCRAAAKYRTTSNLIDYPYKTIRLPAPYFPYVIDEAGREDDAVKEALEQQKKIVTVHYGDDYRAGKVAQVRASLEVEIIKASEYDEKFLQALSSYALAHGKTIWFSGLGYDVRRSVIKEMAGAFEREVNGTTQEEIIESGYKALKKLAPAFAFEDFYLEGRDNTLADIVRKKVDALKREQVMAEAAKLPDDQDVVIELPEGNWGLYWLESAARKCETELWKSTESDKCLYTTKAKVWKTFLEDNPEYATSFALRSVG